MFRQIILFLAGLLFSLQLKCQEKSKVFYPLLNQENIEYEALKPSFFLICQEYLIASRDGTPKYRFGKTYFGRTFAVGILSNDSKIWFPKYVRFPWKTDPNFNEYKETYTPRITGLRYRLLEDTIYRENINVGESPKDTNIAEINFISDEKDGIMYTEDFVNKGTLVIFYSSNPAPENKGDIKHLVVSVNELNWTTDGISYLKDTYIEGERILGGALFQRIITSGNIEWRLAGFYTPINGKWNIYAANMFK